MFQTNTASCDGFVKILNTYGAVLGVLIIECKLRVGKEKYTHELLHTASGWTKC